MVYECIDSTMWLLYKVAISSSGHGNDSFLRGLLSCGLLEVLVHYTSSLVLPPNTSSALYSTVALLLNPGAHFNILDEVHQRVGPCFTEITEYFVLKDLWQELKYINETSLMRQMIKIMMYLVEIGRRVVAIDRIVSCRTQDDGDNYNDNGVAVESEVEHVEVSNFVGDPSFLLCSCFSLSPSPPPRPLTSRIQLSRSPMVPSVSMNVFVDLLQSIFIGGHILKDRYLVHEINSFFYILAESGEYFKEVRVYHFWLLFIFWLTRVCMGGGEGGLRSMSFE